MTAPAPLSSEQVDDLLSAELDGEFDAAAADLGLDPAEARARLAASAGVDARREALAAAQEAVATPVEIDELLEARLRTKAVRAFTAERDATSRQVQRARRTRVLGAVAGVAAAAAGVVALGSMTGNDNDNDGLSTAAGNEAQVLSPTSRSAGDAVDDSPGTGSGRARAGSLYQSFSYGDFDDAGALSEAIKTDRRSDDALRFAEMIPASSNAPQPAATAVRDAFEKGSLIYFGANADNCAPAVEKLAGTARPTSVAAAATVDGRPVIVRFLRDGDTWRAVVLDSACKLVLEQTVG
jgi:hypothetical protein